MNVGIKGQRHVSRLSRSLSSICLVFCYFFLELPNLKHVRSVLKRTLIQSQNLRIKMRVGSKWIGERFLFYDWKCSDVVIMFNGKVHSIDPNWYLKSSIKWKRRIKERERVGWWKMRLLIYTRYIFFEYKFIESKTPNNNNAKFGIRFYTYEPRMHTMQLNPSFPYGSSHNFNKTARKHMQAYTQTHT